MPSLFVFEIPILRLVFRLNWQGWKRTMFKGRRILPNSIENSRNPGNEDLNWNGNIKPSTRWHLAHALSRLLSKWRDSSKLREDGVEKLIKVLCNFNTKDKISCGMTMEKRKVPRSFFWLKNREKPGKACSSGCSRQLFSTIFIMNS